MSATSTRIDRALERVTCQDSGVHAVLLYGNDPTTLDRLGRHLAKGWLCTAESGRPCGQCTACELFEKGEMVDELVVSPMGTSNIIRLAQIAKVKNPKDEDKNLNPIKNFGQIRPVLASHRVVRISEADRMNPDASNALLKTLEEPSSSMRFVLTTQNLGILRSTIISRCLAVPCPAAEDPQGCENPYLAEIFAKLSPRNALSLAERFRSSVGESDDEANIGQRLANTRALTELGLWTSKHDPMASESRKAIAEAHRRTQGNGNFAIITDWLFLQLAQKRNLGNPFERE